MPDRLTIEQRHKNMAAIRGKDTKPEIIVRKYLWSRGFRYRLNHPRLPGHPDIVMRKYKTCIFVNGCFWHGHEVSFAVNGQRTTVNGMEVMDSECCKIPKTNREYWVRKIMRNKERDEEVQRKLSEMGWHSITIWECELKQSKTDAHPVLERLVFTLNEIYLKDHSVNYRDVTKREEVPMAAEPKPSAN